ncbi:hypothetical protein E1301_Tti008821 [Triplophysa tibetana]|uniref:Uncharacterized protein n=1 Tax=Triplophysa tibetana TaxID=1572043 RepID=A0A5A9NZM4_9TELE|nr:hypothetical protein E1301_Tti008821 [Triplophysa tibetana]
MHGLPCSSLEYCFGGPPDASPESAPYPDSEVSKNGSDHVMGPTILTQPGPVKTVRTDSQPSFSCFSIRSKANGTAELGSVNQDRLHSYPCSEVVSEDEDIDSILDTKRPHIPRPSIIRPLRERIQEALPRIKKALLHHSPPQRLFPAPAPHSSQSAPLAKVL